MAKEVDNNALAAELTQMLASAFPGISVRIGRNPRWERPCITFEWGAFDGLLPEERFHRLVRAIPEDFRSERLKGLVWLELAAGETVEDFLKYPRSEDVAPIESQIYQSLADAGFFDSLRTLMGSKPSTTCTGTFQHAIKALIERPQGKDAVQNAKLLFIRRGAYCDCQVLDTVEPALRELYDDE